MNFQFLQNAPEAGPRLHEARGPVSSVVEIDNDYRSHSVLRLIINIILIDHWDW